MARKNKKIIGELHERLMKEFIKQISKSIGNIQRPVIENKADVAKDDSGSGSATEEILAPPEEQHSGPEKINEIRTEVAGTQSAEILNPDKQSELMEIVKQSCEEFERELKRIPSVDNDSVESAVQKFKEELMANVCNQLTEKKYALAG
jgi:hypothetical protein